MSEFENTLENFHEEKPKRDAKAWFSKLIQEEQYVGDLYSTNYEQAKVLVHDVYRQKVGGIPSLCFLIAFISKKIEWRYKKGTPKVFDSRVIFGDSTEELNPIIQESNKKKIKYSLLFTSPPYHSLTDYHADQWIRLWLLGGNATPKLNQDKYKGRFNSKENYIKLLDDVFSRCSLLMAEKSTIYVRTDRREFTYQSTLDVLKKYFPNHIITIKDSPFKRRTQTDLHGNSSKESGEVDLILTK